MKTIWRRILIVSLGCISFSCSSLQKGSVNSSEPVMLQMKGKPGQKEITVFRNKNLTQNFAGDHVAEEKSEVTDFTVEAIVQQATPGTLVYDVTTVDKKGAAPLHDLAFPEPQEKITMIYSPDGRVLKAGEYQRGSVFFLPSLPLPSHAVKPGDTWDFQMQWVGEPSGIPFEVSMAFIFKDIVKCGRTQCARIEVSGDVKIMMVNPREINFASEITGEVLFAIAEGTQVSSKIYSTEKMVIADSTVKVASCMAGELTEAPQKTEPQCEVPSLN